jgi:hypothetical protein
MARKPDGTIVWRASGFDIDDCWTSVRWADGLVANTFSGYAVNLNPDTGEEVSRVFSK